MANETENPTELAPIDTVDLDSLLSEMSDWEECKCESAHINIECTKSVVARKFVGCEPLSFLICQSSYNWNQSILNNVKGMCSSCKKHTSLCWKIVLI